MQNENWELVFDHVRKGIRTHFFFFFFFYIQSQGFIITMNNLDSMQSDDEFVKQDRSTQLCRVKWIMEERGSIGFACGGHGFDCAGHDYI